MMKKPAFVLFVDLSSAFDHVVRSWLFKSIQQRFPPNVDNTLFQILEAVYSHTTTALSETPEDIFNLTTGVRQGGPESPPLYNLFMDYVMRVFEQDVLKRISNLLNWDTEYVRLHAHVNKEDLDIKVIIMWIGELDKAEKEIISELDKAEKEIILIGDTNCDFKNSANANTNNGNMSILHSK